MSRCDGCKWTGNEKVCAACRKLPDGVILPPIAETMAKLNKTDKKKLFHPGIQRFILVLPFRLPTWNALLAMNKWQRKKVRDVIHRAILECIQSGNVSLIPTEFHAKLVWTELQKQEYSETITPRSSKKYRIRKKLEKMKQS